MRRFQITVNGNAYDVTVEELDVGAAPMPAAPVSAPVAPAAPKPAPAPAAQKKATSNEGKVVASPMPGTVLKINVKNGDAVKAGQILCVLEAMKMENEIPAPCDGTVSEISVSVGDAIAGGDTLVVLA